MRALNLLVARNTKLFFKDRGMFCSALISPLILLVLFFTFLADVYRDSLQSILPDGFPVSEELLSSFAGTWLFSSLLAVSCVTVAFIANMIMVQDYARGELLDLTVTPVRRATLSLSYFLATFLSTCLVCYTTFAAGLVYLACVGWFMTLADVLLIALDLFLLILFGTALSSLVSFFLKTQGAISGVCTIVSSMYGFLCGAYMPISQFSEGIRNFISLLPGTYATVLLRDHMMQATMRELGKALPAEFITALRDSFDANLYFFGEKVQLVTIYGVVIFATLVFLLAFTLFSAAKEKQHRALFSRAKK